MDLDFFKGENITVVRTLVGEVLNEWNEPDETTVEFTVTGIIAPSIYTPGQYASGDRIVDSLQLIFNSGTDVQAGDVFKLRGETYKALVSPKSNSELFVNPLFPSPIVVDVRNIKEWK